MHRYIQNIIVPFVNKKTKIEKSHPALAIIDCFQDQTMPGILDLLQENNIITVIVPPNCTNKLQPIDLSIDKPVKDQMTGKFQAMDSFSSGFFFNNSLSFSKYSFLNLLLVGLDMLFQSSFEKCLEARVGPFSVAYLRTYHCSLFSSVMIVFPASVRSRFFFNYFLNAGISCLKACQSTKRKLY